MDALLDISDYYQAGGCKVRQERTEERLRGRSAAEVLGKAVPTQRVLEEDIPRS